MNNWSWAPMQTSNSAYGNFPINRKASATSDLNVDSDTNSNNPMGQQNQNQQQQQLQQFMQFSQPQSQPQTQSSGGGGGHQNNYSFSPQSPPTATLGPHHTHTFENMSGGIQNYPGHPHQSQQQQQQQQQQSSNQNQNQNQNQSQGQEAQIEYLTGQEAMDVLKKIDPNYEYMYQFPPGTGSKKPQQHQNHHNQQQQQQQQGITTQNMMPMEIGSGESPHNYQQQQQQRTNTSVKMSNNNAEAKNVAFSSDINNGSSTRSKKQLSKSKSQGGGIRNQPPPYLQSFYQVPPLVRPNANSPNAHPQHPQVTSSQMKRMVNKPSYKLCGKCPKCKVLQGPPTTNVVNFNMPQNGSNKKLRGGGLASAYSAGNLLHNRFIGAGALGRGHSSTLFPR